MAFNGFGKNSGPGTGAPSVKVNPFASFPNATSPPPPPPPLHPSPSLSAIQRAPSPPLAFQNDQSLRAPSPPSRQFHGHSIPQRTPLPPLAFHNKYSRHDPIQNHSVLHRAPLPHMGFQNNRSLHEGSPSLHQIQRPASSTPAWETFSQLSNNFSNDLSQQDMPLVEPYVGTNDSGRNAPIKHVDVQAPKRVRSPPFPYKDESSGEDLLFDRNFLKRPSLSPSQPSTMSNVRKDNPQSHQLPSQSTPVIGTEAAATKPSNFPDPKRTRSPPLVSSGTVFQENCEQDDNERELQAKAKRAARFKNELNEPMQSSLGIGNQKAALKKRDQSEVEKQKLTEEPSDMTGDDEGPESSTLIIGVCPDMCPESERGERERKGDLDQYERLDGDRNQTTKSLAVKKYTRTAEREADLIRPMPILQKTLDYLLQLLDQPYDDTFLGLYNFLWDRMRAIRMDLRMQHIFNMSAITMLEQMIRLHIIAMHELCLYKKGEGFSEGFDAHLNIEQMNKTSVELFQLYDDHRKRGIDVPTEKEFRGYYALLKLDKHPGYKVEPAELSLDLAKMTPELRQAAEVLFARKVARACRTGNFISFFRLARKASYIQARLMHAHFGKLRSQALASLHSGLQNNQGIPVSQVAKWIGMEEENIDDLLEYHGFSIKDFEEPYMVKEGSFYNSESEYPLKRSKLVHMKKSRTIMEDVSCPSVMEESCSEELKLTDKSNKQKQFPGQFKETESSAPLIDDELTEFEAAAYPKDGMQTKPEKGMSVVDGWSGHEPVAGVLSPAPSTLSFAHSSETLKSSTAHNSFEFPQSGPAQISYESPKSRIAPSSFEIPQSRTAHFSFETPKSISTQISIEYPKGMTKSSGKPIYDTCFSSTSQIVPRSIELDNLPILSKESTLEEPIRQSMLVEDLESVEYSGITREVNVDEVNASHDDEEVTTARLILILRIWRRRSSKKRELRKQKQLAANAALSSLSLGLPMWQHKERQNAAGDFDIDQVMSERYERHERSWSRLNVSDIVAAKLFERNRHARCLCWKVIYSSHSDNLEDKLKPRREVSCFDADLWLRSKIMPATGNHHDDLVVSSPGLSVWRKWFSGQLSGDLTCCFSVIKELRLKSDTIDETIAGASAVLFLLSECISWPAQKMRLSNLLLSIPSGSYLPLLIVNASFKNYLDPSAVAKELGIHGVDRSRISSFLVVPLHEDQQMKHLDCFYSDEQLRKGLQWLASESPLQPLVCGIKTRQLVQAHLNASLEGLDDCHANKVGPESCVAAFNEALDRSIEDVSNAANANTTFWPCPEIALLEKSSYEHRVVDIYLPRLRWSSAATVEPLLCALNDCKLPPFQDGTSWLTKDSDIFYGIENQKLQLEGLLVRYLTQSSHLMGLPLARKEASIMLQVSARLDLHNSAYNIVPQWLAIFRRIFNWRLMNLHSGPFSTAYVLEQQYVAIITSVGSSKLDVESGKSSNYNFNRPSLDEMVEVSCSPYSEHESFYTPPSTVYHGLDTQKFSFEPNSLDEGRNFGRYSTVAETENNDHVTNRSSITSSDLIVGAKATKEADRLSKLLEQCNIVQNMIDKKLSIYFQ